jgi:ATP-dependent protease ClpP protease subunit
VPINKANNIDFRCELVNETENSVDVYMYGSIVDEVPRNWLTGEKMEGDFIFPKNVREMVNEAGDKDINIHLNSKGGHVFASIPIHNFLKQAENKITVYIDGIAASGASIIAMAADKVIMPSNTNMMIHRASTGLFGNADDFLKQAETLEKIDESVMESYMGRFVGSKEELIELISEDSWLTAEECITFGLADEIIKAKKDDDDKNVQANIKKNLFNKYKKEINNKTTKPDDNSGLFNSFKK